MKIEFIKMRRLWAEKVNKGTGGLRSGSQRSAGPSFFFRQEQSRRRNVDMTFSRMILSEWKFN